MRIYDDFWLVTFSGKQFWPLSPDPEDICIDDIAHALANICRFGGHCRRFYSVAQHSVLVSKICGNADAFQGLMHDAAEAYFGDIIRPIKKHPYFSDVYKDVEKRLWDAIANKFGIDTTIQDSVKRADDVALLTEKRDLIVPHDFIWTDVHVRNGGKGLTTLLQHIVPVGPDMAKAMFINRFLELTGGSK